MTDKHSNAVAGAAALITATERLIDALEKGRDLDPFLQTIANVAGKHFPQSVLASKAIDPIDDILYGE